MTHPSDETFLDEMAETLKAVEPDDGVYPALVVSVPDFLRLVALARRAPALTCRAEIWREAQVDMLTRAQLVVDAWLSDWQSDDVGSDAKLLRDRLERLRPPAPPEARP